MKVEKINAVITGGGSGLGEGTARVLKEKGANIFLIDLNEEKWKNISSELGCEYFVGDVSNPELMSEAIKNLENINCLINCAGIAAGAKIVSSRGIHDFNLFEKVLKINLIGSFNMLRLCAEIYGVKHIGSIKALTTALMVFATAFGTALFGVLIDYGFSIEKIAVVSGIYIIVSIVLLFFIRKKLNPINI